MYVVIWGQYDLKKIGCVCVAQVIGKDGRAYNIKIPFSLFLLIVKSKKRIWQLVVGRIIGIMTTLSVLSSNYW